MRVRESEKKKKTVNRKRIYELKETKKQFKGNNFGRKKKKKTLVRGLSNHSQFFSINILK
jgi:hypothetical protein